MRKGITAAGRTLSSVTGAFIGLPSRSLVYLRAARSGIRARGGPSRSCHTKDDVVHSIPAEVPQQLTQAPLRTLEVHVMTKARFRAYALDAGLLGVDFPGMKIEDRRLLVVRVHVLDQPARDRVGHEAEITAAAGRPVGTE